MDRKPNIALLTHEFPFGNSETSFIEPELPFLREHFNLSHIFTFPGGELTTSLDQSVEVQKYHDWYNPKVKFTKMVKFYLRIFLPFIFSNSLKLIRLTSWSERKMVISQFLKHYRMAVFIHNHSKKDTIDVFYSYWFDHWNVAASIYKLMYNKDVKIVSRVHRYEIDSITKKDAYFPYHTFQLKHSNMLCFISKKWCEYMRMRHPNHASKMSIHQMGVDVSKQSILTPKHPPYHLLSISGNIPVKRMNIQAEALNQLNSPVVWHHFGMNEKDDSIKNMLSSSLVKYINHGFVPIAQLNKWLSETPIHFLLNTSEVEGVPVSMMECIRQGIPIIAIDVGGVSEIVNQSTGVLCNADIQSVDLAKQIEENLRQYRFINSNRQNVRDFQEEYFSAPKNYNGFFIAIKEQVATA